jgi:hypothetical protein
MIITRKAASERNDPYRRIAASKYVRQTLWNYVDSSQLAFRYMTPGKCSYAPSRHRTGTSRRGGPSFPPPVPRSSSILYGGFCSRDREKNRKAPVRVRGGARNYSVRSKASEVRVCESYVFVVDKLSDSPKTSCVLFHPRKTNKNELVHLFHLFKNAFTSLEDNHTSQYAICTLKPNAMWWDCHHEVGFILISDRVQHHNQSLILTVGERYMTPLSG